MLLDIYICPDLPTLQGGRTRRNGLAITCFHFINKTCTFVNIYAVKKEYENFWSPAKLVIFILSKTM